MIGTPKPTVEPMILTPAVWQGFRGDGRSDILVEEESVESVESVEDGVTMTAAPASATGGEGTTTVGRVTDIVFVATVVLAASNAALALRERSALSPPLFALGLLLGLLCLVEQGRSVLHLDRREVSGDAVVETRVWFDGKAERHVAIAGKGSDPIAAVTAGVVGMIGHRLPGGPPLSKVGEPDEVKLAQLAERGQWLDLLSMIAGVKNRTPRQSYYEVLAYTKLGQRDPRRSRRSRRAARWPEAIAARNAAT